MSSKASNTRKPITQGQAPTFASDKRIQHAKELKEGKKNQPVTRLTTYDVLKNEERPERRLSVLAAPPPTQSKKPVTKAQAPKFRSDDRVKEHGQFVAERSKEEKRDLVALRTSLKRSTTLDPNIMMQNRQNAEAKLNAAEAPEFRIDERIQEWHSNHSALRKTGPVAQCEDLLALRVHLRGQSSMHYEDAQQPDEDSGPFSPKSPVRLSLVGPPSSFASASARRSSSFGRS